MFIRRSYSQFQDEDDLGFALKHFMQGDDVRVLDLLQDGHLSLDVFLRHAAPTRLVAPLLDEFGGVLRAGSPVPTSSDHGELTAVDEKRGC